MLHNLRPYLGRSPCDLCGGQTFELIAERDRRGNALQTVICRVCGLLSHAQLPTEEELADYLIETDFSKPVVVYIAGRSAPSGKKMGHAGAIMYGERGSVEYKEKKLSHAGAIIANSPDDVGIIVSQVVQKIKSNEDSL